MAVWGGLTNSCEKKRSEKQIRKGKIYPFECRDTKKSKETYKSFLSDQRKEIEENNRMGKTRDLFKKTGDTQETVHAKISTIKDRNMARTWERQKTLRKGGKNTQKKLYKKGLKEPDNHNGVITHLEPDILECEVKWALGSLTTNKAHGDDGIPAELFLILIDDAVNALHSIYQKIWKTLQWPQDWKRSVFIPVPKTGNKLWHNCTHFTY